MRILLSGASGFIGSEVFRFLTEQGSEVIPLKRGDPAKSHSQVVFWDPERSAFIPHFFEHFDAVIHLAGEPLFGLWTLGKKKRIASSRIDGTALLAYAFSQVTHLPKVFLSASAVGFYGDGGETWLTENHPPGDGFLASVCKDWELATAPFRDRGVRVVNTRFGVVLSEEGGMLKKMHLPFSLGLGAIFGSGEQWLSWIAREDLVRAIAHCLNEPSLEGPVNCVSPHPVRQQEFARQFAKHLRRPLFLRLPAWLLHAVLGQMADEMLLSSQRVKPEKLLHQRFVFKCSSLEQAL